MNGLGKTKSGVVYKITIIHKENGRLSVIV